MDIISYGIAAQVTRAEKKMRETTLAVGVEGNHPHARSRVDALERAYQGITDRANQLAIQDAVNIMKAHAKLNVVAKSTKYKMHQMVFEDFLSATGIDSAKSSGYTVDTTNGLVKASGAGNYTMVTTQEVADTVPKKVVLMVEEKSNGLIPVMTAEATPSGRATASSTTNGAPYLAFNGTANGYTDRWFTSFGTGAWIQYQFPSQQVVDKYTITAVNGDNGAGGKRCCKDWRFLGSNDGVNWTSLDQRSGIANWVDGMKQEFTVGNPGNYQYYRVDVSALSTGNDGNIEIGDIQMFSISMGYLGNYSISRDDGATWEPITPEELFYFKDSISPINTKLRLKAELPSNVQLLNYGLTWV